MRQDLGDHAEAIRAQTRALELRMALLGPKHAELASVYYAELLRDWPKAQALREAKLRTMGRNPEYAKPYYWPSLVLVGQWR